MKFTIKNIWVIILVMITIINIVTGVVIFSNVQIMKSPEVTVNLEMLEINSDEAVIQTIMEMYNPNDFEITVKNMKIITTALNGDEVSRAVTKGGVIPPKENKEFSAISNVNYKGQSPETLKSKITGEVGLKAWFVEKTVPLSMNVIASIGELINNIVSPDINMKISFGEITQKYVNISFSLSVYNPNNLNVSVKDINLEIKNETDIIVGNFRLPDTIIKAKENTIINGTGNIEIKSLNADELNIDMTSTIIGHIAGYDKSIPLNVTTTVITPDIKELLPSDFPTETILKGDYHISLRGLVGEITFETKNPNNIELDVKDIILTVYRIDKKY